MNVAELRNYFNVNNLSGRADTDTHMNSAKVKNVSFNTERSTETQFGFKQNYRMFRFILCRDGFFFGNADALRIQKKE